VADCKALLPACFVFLQHSAPAYSAKVIHDWTIASQAVTKDTSLQAYIRLLTAAAPSDSVFRALGTN